MQKLRPILDQIAETTPYFRLNYRNYTLFKTKLQKLHPISDQIAESTPYFRPNCRNYTLFQTRPNMRNYKQGSKNILVATIFSWISTQPWINAHVE